MKPQRSSHNSPMEEPGPSSVLLGSAYIPLLFGHFTCGADVSWLKQAAHLSLSELT